MRHSKKMLIPLLATVVLVAGCITVGAFAAAASDSVSTSEIVIDENCGPESYPLNNQPDVLYEDNANVLNERSDTLITLDSVLDADTVAAAGGEIISSEYQTYNNFLENESMSSNRSTQIGDERIVLVVTIYYPDGFTHAKVGLIQNCVAVGIYDAETGDYLGGEFNTVEGDYSAK